LTWTYFDVHLRPVRHTDTASRRRDRDPTLIQKAARLRVRSPLQPAAKLSLVTARRLAIAKRPETKRT